MKEEQLTDIFMLVVKPNANWTEEMDGADYSIIPFSDKEDTAVIMDLEEEHHVIDLDKFQVYNVPKRFNEFKLKNASLENKTYLITKKDVK